MKVANSAEMGYAHQLKNAAENTSGTNSPANALSITAPDSGVRKVNAHKTIFANTENASAN